MEDKNDEAGYFPALTMKTCGKVRIGLMYWVPLTINPMLPSPSSIIFEPAPKPERALTAQA